MGGGIAQCTRKLKEAEEHVQYSAYVSNYYIVVCSFKEKGHNLISKTCKFIHDTF